MNGSQWIRIDSTPHRSHSYIASLCLHVYAPAQLLALHDGSLSMQQQVVSFLNKITHDRLVHHSVSFAVRINPSDSIKRMSGHIYSYQDSIYMREHAIFMLYSRVLTEPDSCLLSIDFVCACPWQSCHFLGFVIYLGHHIASNILCLSSSISILL
jgi:hypothetical protein